MTTGDSLKRLTFEQRPEGGEQEPVNMWRQGVLGRGNSRAEALR